MKVRFLIALLFLSCSIAMAAPPQNQQYIVKLKYLYQQPNASAAAPLKNVVTRGGGHVDYEGLDGLVITLPDNAVEAIAKHSATKYMQLVRTRPPAPRPATQTISTSSVNAGAPPAVARALSAPLRLVPTSSSTWDSGTYVYDGAGNITGIGTDSFTYDSLSRLATSSIKGNTETYTYDQFGNLIYKTTTPAHGPALSVDLTTSTATNRLSAQPYDTATSRAPPGRG
jgi:YD repeat-containing protein